MQKRVDGRLLPQEEEVLFLGILPKIYDDVLVIAVVVVNPMTPRCDRTAMLLNSLMIQDMGEEAEVVAALEEAEEDVVVVDIVVAEEVGAIMVVEVDMVIAIVACRLQLHRINNNSREVDWNQPHDPLRNLLIWRPPPHHHMELHSHLLEAAAAVAIGENLVQHRYNEAWSAPMRP